MEAYPNLIAYLTLCVELLYRGYFLFLGNYHQLTVIGLYKHSILDSVCRIIEFFVLGKLSWEIIASILLLDYTNICV